MKDQIWQTLEQLPKWGKGSESGYWVSWTYPAFYRKFAQNICRCHKLHIKIAEKCQDIINSGVFDLDYVELKFYTQGLIIDVPGDRTCVYPANDCYTSHNIDTAYQCFGLLTFLTASLEEIIATMGVWADDSQVGLDLPFQDHSYRIERLEVNKPYTLWEIYDFESFTAVGLFFARGRWEAERTLAKFYPGKDMQSRTTSERNYCERLLFPIKQYRATIEFENNFPQKTYEILAFDEAQAEKLMGQYLENAPPLSAVTKMTIEQTRDVIEPVIFPI